MFKKLPNSTRKFIRLEKARIRRQFLDYKTQEEAIANMYNKISGMEIEKTNITNVIKATEETKVKEKPKITKRINKKATKTKTTKKKK